jgi:ammonia channel protein AmtB
MGYKDYGGAGVVHLTAGVAGFVGTYLIGPRSGLFRREPSIEYILDEENFDNFEENMREGECKNDN